MRLSALAALSAAFLLSGCSYTYTVLATVIDGHIAFIVDPKSNGRGCLNLIEVRSDRTDRTVAAPGDDVSRVGYGTYWYARADHECRTKWPIRYGAPLKGTADLRTGRVAAKPLRVGVVYTINTVSGSTGYGEGAFIIRPDRTVENVPVSSPPPGNAN